MPDHRKKRLATRMIETLRDKVHPEGLDLVLEPTTEAKKQFYERMGFISKGVKSFTGLKGDECRMWSMIWPAPAQESSTSTAE
ncbi:hypothetical protein ONZ45_g19459 [Pleurotus djamor]|nr:hypothetical protein ONZ45_g19459 [Pleurotus djamor]